MSAELTIAGIVSSENDEDKRAKPVEEEEDVTSNDNVDIQDTECQDKKEIVEISFGYNPNIYNAFILFQGLKIKDTAIVQDLRVASYLTLVVQSAAILILIRLVMLQSGISLADDYKMETWPIENSLVMFPFFIIAFLAIGKEGMAAMTERFMFRKDERLELSDEAYFFKSAEFCMIAPSLVFSIVIALYANHDWNGILSSVLNLLAYQFILQLDELVLSMSIVNAKLRFVLQKEGRPELGELEGVFTGKIPEIFKDDGQTKREDDDSVPPLITLVIVSVFVYAMIIQAIYSRSWVMFCFLPLWICCVSIVGSIAMLPIMWSDDDDADANVDVDHDDDNMTML
jgi:hypothetical protein